MNGRQASIEGIIVPQPRASWIAHGGCRVINTTWSRPVAVGQYLAIYAAASNIYLHQPEAALDADSWPQMPAIETLPLGVFVAVARVGSVARFGPELAGAPGARGPFCWCLDLVVPIVAPVPMRHSKTRPGLWRLPESTKEELRQAWRRSAAARATAFRGGQAR